MDVTLGTVIVWSDIGCPFAHTAVSRLHRYRAELGLDAVVRFDHRAFPLELINEEPTPKATVDAEVAVLAAVEPDAGWKAWDADASTWPVTTLPGLEAVQAAKAQGLAASEQLDRALRVAFFAESRCISLRHVLLEIARACDRVDDDALAEALDDGRSRSAVIEQWRQAPRECVKGSPHVFVVGADSANPGLTVEFEGDHRPVIVSDDPDVYRGLLRRASGAAIS